MFVNNVFKLVVLYPEHSQLVFDCVVIACSIESIRQGLVQGCKAPNSVGSACFVPLWSQAYPTENGLFALSLPPPGLELATSPLALVKLYCHY